VASSAPGTPEAPSSSSPWSPVVALVVAAAFFIEALDGTIVATAAPAMARDLHVTPADVGISITAYLCAVAALIPLSGWLSDRIGAKRLFLSAIVVFAIASVACAASQSLVWLAAARVLQGMAGAMMTPVGRLVVLRGTPKTELVRAMAYLTWPGLLAPVIAPFVGGVITDLWGWHWIFLVNLPVCALLIVYGLRYLPRDEAGERRRLDVLGFVVAALGIVALVLGLQWVVDAEWWPLGAGLLVLAAAAIAMTIVRGLRRPGSVLDFRAYRFPTFAFAGSSGTVYRATLQAAPFLLPLLLQTGFGWSAAAAGAMVMWLFIGNIGIKPATTPILRALGFRWMIAVATIAVALTFLFFAWMPADLPIVLMAAVLLVSGVARSIGFTGYVTVQFADVPKDMLNDANLVGSVLFQLGQGLSVGIASASVAAIELLSHAGPEAAVRWTLVLMAVLVASSLIGVVRLPRGAGAHIVRPRRSASSGA